MREVLTLGTARFEQPIKDMSFQLPDYAFHQHPHLLIIINGLGQVAARLHTSELKHLLVFYYQYKAISYVLSLKL